MLLGVILEMKIAAARLVAGVAFEANRFNWHLNFFFLEDRADQGNPGRGGGGSTQACLLTCYRGGVVRFQGFQGFQGFQSMPPVESMP